MRLSEAFVERGLEKAKGSKFMGVPLEDLTRDELIAVAAEGWAAYNGHIKDSIATMQFLREIRK